ncbi:hypothetical protein CYLTODRAFT_417889 [Cylindrobasidium torrendii FP15055 ss-10]|uniref:Uncharacterized protein n=1 Tax=Cylindrobasidium torrendii FP15055 ss-10 TaxID=1314674 RepID=A0A0D7BSC0_9AGAR|nr:hypothetical protein CYLTODRAFT_417889 [Cylindrobasidium torrendii FP15055 ss-10]
MSNPNIDPAVASARPIPFPLADETESSSEPIVSQTVSEPGTSSSVYTASDKVTELPPSVSAGRSHRASGSRTFHRSFDNSHGLLPSMRPALDRDALSSTNALGLSFTPSHSLSNTPRYAPQMALSTSEGSTPAKVSLERQAHLNSHHPLSTSNSSPLHKAADDSRGSPRSRATSPLRIIERWSQSRRQHHHREEDPFVPINPFKLNWHLHWPRLSCSPCPCCLPISETSASSVHDETCFDCSQLGRQTRGLTEFLRDTLPRFVYLYMLLCLPAMYFTRVSRIFQEADVSRPDIQRMIDACSRPGYNIPMSADINREGTRRAAAPPGLSTGIGIMGHVGSAALLSDDTPLTVAEDWTAPYVSPALVRFKHSWEAFIDSLLREWKTLNVVSALLLSAIMTMFQVEDAVNDPLTRTAALLSLICALMSLSYGCMYIVRFGTMRSMYRASRWAEEARKTDTLIWWNVWVMLAMPVVWLSWAMIGFLVSILSFVWQTGSTSDPEQRPALSPTAVLGPRIAVTGVFAIGMMYFVLIVHTLSSYGSHGELYESMLHPGSPDIRRGREMRRGRGRVESDVAEPASSNYEKGQGTEALELEVRDDRDDRRKGIFGSTREVDLERGKASSLE